MFDTGIDHLLRGDGMLCDRLFRRPGSRDFVGEPLGEEGKRNR
jgi:hypothetical protein